MMSTVLEDPSCPDMKKFFATSTEYAMMYLMMSTPGNDLCNACRIQGRYRVRRQS
jgi:hypothetical protein